MRIKLSILALALGLGLNTSRAAGPTPDEARAIAKEACIYGYPMVDSYRINHAYWLLPGNPEFKGPLNQLVSMARLFTPEDKAVQTPNSDTPYSFFGADLRTEPMVITVPEVEKERYYSIQLVDAYTHNFAYIGSRTKGNSAANYLLAGPGWKGAKPAGIKEVIASETNFVLAIYRTQLFRPDDMDAVRKIQAGYRLQPLSKFLGQPAPAAAPALDYIKPCTPSGQKTSLELFSVLNFVLNYCPTVPSETALMARFAQIGVGAGKAFDATKLSPEIRQALEQGMADAWEAFDDFKRTEIDSGKVTSGDLFGSRDSLRNNYLYRMAAAILGIFGNSKAEAMYPLYTVDGAGGKLDAANHRYKLRFAPGELPPVHAFWSVTMYDLPRQLLVENPLNRYLLNSPMLPQFRKDADGGVTLHIQNESPGKDKEANWLPAPKGPFMLAMRLYWPKEEALTGGWTAPKLQMVP
ncbi:MAG: cell envelope protein [Verrucomicrobiales bacterium]|nr:cell envelope protein [Verrucomicrobiales bacterium]